MTRTGGRAGSAPALPTWTVRRSSILTPAVLVVLLVVLLGCSPAGPDPAGVQISRSAVDPDHGYHGTVPPEPWPLPPQSFTDDSGNAYNLATTPSKPVTLVFFGYTHCPDVCVGVLSDLASALKRSDSSVRGEIQVVFITTDPHRDTPSVIASYLARFDPDFTGLTGRSDQIDAAAAALGVEISGTRKSGEGYLVSHSAQVIGFDKNGRAAVWWPSGTPIGDLRADFALLVQRQR